MTDQAISPNSDAAELDTKAPDTKAPDTKAPDTKAPDTKAPDTKTSPVGDAGKSWLDALNLPEDLREHATVKKYAANPEGLVRGMIHLEGHMGVPPEQLIRMPKPDDAEGMAKVWDRLGRPESPDKYQVKLPDGGALDDAGLQAFLGRMHKAGPMTPQLAQAAVDFYADWVKDQQAEGEKALKAQRDAWERELRQEWGGQYEANLDAAAELAEKFGDDDYVQFLKDSGLGGDKRHLQFMAKVAKAFGEPGVPDAAGKGGGGDRKGGLTPAEAEAELARYNDPNSEEHKALNDASHGNHEYHVNRRNSLFQMKRGQPPR